MSFLGVDLGTSGVRVVAVSRDGTTIAAHRVSTRLSTTGVRVESDAAEILRAAETCAREVVASSAVRADPPEAVGFSSQGEAVVAVDDALTPVAPMPVSMDGRGGEAFADFGAIVSGERFQEITGQPAHPMFSLFKLLAADDAWRHAARVVGIADLVAGRWGAEPTTDHTQAARFGLLAVDERVWSEEILDAAHALGATWLTPSRLPRVAPAGTIAGHLSSCASALTSIPAGTPIVVGMHDQAAAYLGAGGRVEESSVVSFGSSDCLVVGTERRPAGLVGTGLATYPLVDGAWMTLAGTAAGGWSLQWLNSIVGSDQGRLGDLLDQIAEDPPALLVLPYLAGSGTLDNDPSSTGVVAGLTLSTTRADLVRAFMESAGFELGRIVEALDRRGVRVGSLLATGAGSTNPRALAVRADALGAALRAVEPEAAGRGAALVAGLAVGAYPGLDALPPPAGDEPTQPEPRWQEWYATQQERYAELVGAGRALFRHP